MYRLLTSVLAFAVCAPALFGLDTPAEEFKAIEKAYRDAGKKMSGIGKNFCQVLPGDFALTNGRGRRRSHARCAYGRTIL
jgi:hypothetical protein